MRKKSNHRKPATSSPPAKGSPRAGGARPSGSGGQRQGQREPEIPKAWRGIAGFHAINEALKVRPKAVKALWLKQGWESSEELTELNNQVVRFRGKVEVKSATAIEKICASHQGAVLFVEGRPEFSMKKMSDYQRSVLVYLDGIEDPHNLGAILRTSWLVGAHALFIPEERAVGLTPTAHKVACGGVEHVPVQEVGSFANYAKDLKEKGYWIFGLSHKATKTIFDVEIPDKIIWAVGSEDKGLRVTTERLCDELVSIPQISAAASYNASVATAMALTESLRKHTTQHMNRKKSQ